MIEEPARYERSDISPRIVSFFALGLVVTCIVAALLIRLFEKDLDRFFAYHGTASWTSSPKMVVPPPQLQVDSIRELGELRAREETILHSYDWVDRPHGVIRVPIDVAMQLLLERGLPVRPATAPATPRPAP